MNRPLALALILFTTSGSLACGSDESSTSDAGVSGPVNPEQVKSAVTWYASGAAKAVAGGYSTDMLASLELGAQALSFAALVGSSPGAGTPPTGGTKPATVQLKDMTGRVSQALTSCKDACSGTTCDFKGCTVSEDSVASGRLSWTGGNVKCEGLTIEAEISGKNGAAPGGKYKIALECDLKASADALSGTVKGTVSITGDDLAPSGTTSEVQINVKHSPVSSNTGRVTVTSGSAKATVTDTLAGQVYRGAGEVTFP